MEAGNTEAIRGLGIHYSEGYNGLPRDMNRALDLRQRAVGLGNKEACNDIGIAYLHGKGLEIDMQKARHYWELGSSKNSHRIIKNGVPNQCWTCHWLSLAPTSLAAHWHHTTSHPLLLRT